MVYLDNAATTFEKPESVFEALERARYCGGAGRSGHGAARFASDALFLCREAAAELFHTRSPEQIALTYNATHALNYALLGLAEPGKTVVISGYEHNAVARPVHALTKRGVSVTVAESPLFDADAQVEAYRDALSRGGVSCAALNHVSNVFGSEANAEAIAEICAERGVPMILDASQSAGVLGIDTRKLPGTIICCPGHKGLYGAQGTGLLITPKDVKIPPLIGGGTGSSSYELDMPEDVPDAFEAGTPNAWGALCLTEGIRYVLTRTPAKIAERERRLKDALVSVLNGIKGVTLYTGAGQTGVVSMNFPDVTPETAAEFFAERGICVRAGLHCAPLAHRSAGTLPGGTVRVSFSDFNTPADVAAFAAAVTRLTARASL